MTGGSIAVKQPSIFMEWIEKFGSEKIILGADVKNQNIAIDGWVKVSNKNIFDFIDNFQKKGVRYVICTDIEKDGMLKGVSINLYEKILNKFDKIKLIASGGLSDIDQIRGLKKIGCFGVIIGKAIYEKSIDLKTLSNFTND